MENKIEFTWKKNKKGRMEEITQKECFCITIINLTPQLITILQNPLMHSKMHYLTN